MSADAAQPDRSSGPFGLPRWAAWALAVLFFFVVAFGVGYMAGSSPVADLETRVEQAESRAQVTEERVAALEAELSAHRGLALLYRAILDVDARNFGIANDRLAAVESQLAGIDPARLGVDAEAFVELRGRIEALDVRVAEDLAAQRSTLADLASRLAGLLEG